MSELPKSNTNEVESKDTMRKSNPHPSSDKIDLSPTKQGNTDLKCEIL